MRRDFKIGVFIGAGLAIVAFVVLSVLPGESIESRLRKRATVTNEPATGQAVIAKPVEDIKMIPKPEPEIENRLNETNQPAMPTKRTYRTHVVARGETLSSIARDYFGNTDWSKIGKANPAVAADPGRLKVGTRLIIPE